MTTKRPSRQLKWYHDQRKPPIIEGVPTLPDRVIAANPSAVEEAEFQRLVISVGEQLREA